MKTFGFCLLFCVFFVLGCLTSSYPLPGVTKSVAFLRGNFAAAQGLSPNLVQMGLGGINFITAALVLAWRSRAKTNAIICVTINMIVLGNCFLPRMTESERVAALMTTYKGVGLIGALLLI